MRVIPERTAVVIAGAWNQAIFTRDWVGDNILTGLIEEAPEPEFQLASSTMKYGSAELPITLTVSPHRVLVHPVTYTQEAVAAQEAATLRLLDHTYGAPLSGVGVNIGLDFMTDSPRYWNMFTLPDDSTFAKETSYKLTADIRISRKIHLVDENALLTVSVFGVRGGSETSGIGHLDFNFHKDALSAQEIRTFASGKIGIYYSEAVRLADIVYGVK